jgi:membrane protein DedA with SNARE-associated domain
MKKDTKKKIKKVLSESITELGLAVIFLLSGAVVASLFGLVSGNKNVSFNVLILIGFAVLLVAAVLFYIIRLTTKKRQKKSDEINDTHEEK